MPADGSMTSSQMLSETAEERKLRHRQIDKAVGARMRYFRKRLGLSQEKLGEALGLTFQQIQKYERGDNRVAASRLHDVAAVLEVSFADLMGGMNETSSQRGLLAEVAAVPGAIELVQHYGALPVPQRYALLGLMREWAPKADLETASQD